MGSRKFLILLLCALTMSACTVWENPAEGWRGATGAEQFERQLWKDIADQKWASVEQHVATNFSATTPAGTLDRSDAILEWKRLQIEQYSLGDFQVRTNGSDVVVTYTMLMRGQREGQPLPARPVQMMSVWQQLSRGWVLIAHAVSPTA